MQVTTENVKLIREKLKIARNRRKSYVNKRRRDLEFEVGDKVFSSYLLGKVFYVLEGKGS